MPSDRQKKFGNEVFLFKVLLQNDHLPKDLELNFIAKLNFFKDGTETRMLVKGRWEDPRLKTEMELYFSQFKTGMKTMESIFKYMNARVKAENQMYLKQEEASLENNSAESCQVADDERSPSEKKMITSDLKA